MANVVGVINTSHVPSIGGAIAHQMYEDPYWKPFFDGYPPVHEWLAKVKPDVAVIFSNDHGLNFFLDKMPTFAIGAAPEYRNADEGWGIPTLAPVQGDLDLSWHLINSVVEDEFDVMTCQEMNIDHGISLPIALLWPEQTPWPIRAVPVIINTVQHPLPSAARCLKLGQSIGRALQSYDSEDRIVVIGTGGLSHQLDGGRAGFINKEFDQTFMEKLISDPEWTTRYSNEELVELTGTQGIELLMWLAARGTVDAVTKVHSNYHIPISNTAAGLLAMETRQ